MPKNLRSQRNDRTRVVIGEIIAKLKVGDRIESPSLATQLSSRRKTVNARTVGLLLRELHNMKMIRYRVWEKIEDDVLDDKEPTQP